MSVRTRKNVVQPVVRRQVHTYHLVAISKAVLHELSQQMSPEAAAEVIEKSVRGECGECDFALRGKDLLALAGSEAPTRSRKLALFREGYCGSYDCKSYYYSVGFYSHPGVDWDRIKLGLDAATSPKFSTEEKITVPFWKIIPKRTQLICLAVVISLMFLALARHAYNGGQIPLLREARHFRVVPARISESLP